MMSQFIVFCLAMGFSQMALTHWDFLSSSHEILRIFGFAGGITCWGAFIGGCFGRMGYGILAIWGFLLVCGFLLALLAPGVR